MIGFGGAISISKFECGGGNVGANVQTKLRLCWLMASMLWSAHSQQLGLFEFCGCTLLMRKKSKEHMMMSGRDCATEAASFVFLIWIIQWYRTSFLYSYKFILFN